MTRFNPKKVTSTKTVNKEGGLAYQPSMKLELMLRTMSTLMSGDGFYAKQSENNERMAALVKAISPKDKDFVPKLAVKARNEMYLRSVPMFLMVEYARAGIKNPGAYRYIPHIIRRADEPAEMLAAYFSAVEPGAKRNTAPIPSMLKKGIGMALNQFDEYQFGKYNRDGNVKLKDVVLLTHPKPATDKNQELFDKIVEGKLAVPDTWETYISAHGSSKESWEAIIPKMGYMALLRNLRNFHQHNVDPLLVTRRLVDPVAVSRSKQFPYRFFSAYRELQSSGANKYMDAVNDAMELSVKNVPKIPGKTAIFSDNSSSMHANVSAKSAVQNIEVAALFSAISLSVCEESLVGVFGQTYADVGLSKRSTILDNMQKVRNTNVGHSTEAWKAIHSIYTRGMKFDRIFIFSDMQCYDAERRAMWSERSMSKELNLYRKDINPECRLYSFDLAQYATLQFPEHDTRTCPIGGYSDAIFRYVPMFEADRGTMLKDIESLVIE